MSNVATIERPAGPSIIATMAERYSMMPAAFEATLRATVVPKECTREQFAAFLLVANEYGLNPILKEIHAFPARGGGIQPVVSIDGWVRLMNSHPQMDGIEFVDHVGDKKTLDAISARIYRKDRSHPIVVTEYMSECRRNTDTWKQWPHRMLRHKALIQCVRVAFGYSNIPDVDDAEAMGANIGRMRDVSPPPAPPQAPKALAASRPTENDPFDEETGEIQTPPEPGNRQAPAEGGGGGSAVELPQSAPDTTATVPAQLTAAQRLKLQAFAADVDKKNRPADVMLRTQQFWTDHDLTDDDRSPLATAANAIMDAHLARTRGEISIDEATAAVRKVLPL